MRIEFRREAEDLVDLERRGLLTAGENLDQSRVVRNSVTLDLRREASRCEGLADRPVRRYDQLLAPVCGETAQRQQRSIDIVAPRVEVMTRGGVLNQIDVVHIDDFFGGHRVS